MSARASRRRLFGRAMIYGGLLAYPLAILSGSSAAVFLATALVAHLPFVAGVTLMVFRGWPSRRIALAGWFLWLVSAFLWEFMYQGSYRALGWPTPDLPGEIQFGPPFGWAPALGMAAIAGLIRTRVDRWIPESP